MLFDDLATELVLGIFHSCTSISDVLALSSTCRRLRRIYSCTQKLEILRHAAEAEYGPLRDAVQLVTHNSTQPAHIVRDVPLSLSLLKQLLHTGRVADAWCDIYPFKKWKHDFESRRLLTSSERRALRAALYRLWLYTRAFHNSAHPRLTRLRADCVQARLRLLHRFSTAELADMADVHAVLRAVVRSDVCPDNGTIARRVVKRFPEPESRPQLLFNVNFLMNCGHAQQPDAAHYLSHHAHVAAKWKYLPSARHEPGAEGWGDAIQHYYVVEDMLKLDPAQILWLRDNAPLKAQVEAFVKGLGAEWFEDNGETWVHALESVLVQRGTSVGELWEEIEEGRAGVARVLG